MTPTAPRRRRWSAALVTTLALLSAGPARAVDSAQPDPVVGIAIAELGNRALQQIRRELACALLENARPGLPEMPTLAASWDTTPAANTP